VQLPNMDGEDLSAMDEDASYPGVMSSKYRFDQLIKTMIARIEYNNTLAPVQEYGRHQTRALKNKKKGKTNTQGSGAGADEEDGGKKPRKDYDDRFYDLDDGFIDDGDMEDGYGGGLDGMMGGPPGFDDHMMNDDMYDDELTTNQQQSSMNVEYDPLADEKKENAKEEKKYQQMIKRFRVILPDEVDQMMNSHEGSHQRKTDGNQSVEPNNRATP